LIPEPLTKLGHALFGFICALSVLVSPVLTVVGFVLFVVYELDEYFHLSDEAYEEIREFGYGFGAGIFLLLLLRFLNLI
jgi:hypothetical protein